MPNKSGKTRDLSIYTPQAVGKTRAKTPEGFLLCRDVAIARTGDMLYGAGEVPIDDDAGLIVVTRDADEVFRPETIASYEGKSVTIDHPDDWVGPKNWRDLSVGVVQNVRRGEGIEDHLLLADLLITDAAAISDIEGGKREVSCGYDADYEQTAKGKGIQRNIIGNHVALVDKGRCGSRCAIGDQAMPQKTIPKKPTFGDRLRKAFMSKDAEAAEALAKEAEETEDADGDEDGKEDSKTADTLALILKKLGTMDARMSNLEKTRDADPEPDTETETETETEDDDGDEPDTETEDEILTAEPAGKKSDTGEEKYTGDSLQAIRARAEILSPGLNLPTLDAKASDVAKVATRCKCQALDAAYRTEVGKAAIDPFLNGRTAAFHKLPRHTLDAAFIGASELIKQQNNQRGARSGITTRDFGRAPPSIAEINAANRQHYNRK